MDTSACFGILEPVQYFVIFSCVNSETVAG